MQKKTKVSLGKKLSKNVPFKTFADAAAMELGAGSQLIFNMIGTFLTFLDSYNNNTATLVDFDKLYRLSLVYLNFDPSGNQRLYNEIV